METSEHIWYASNKDLGRAFTILRHISEFLTPVHFPDHTRNLHPET